MSRLFERTLLWVLSALLLVLVFFACWQVFFRYVVGKPCTFTIELLKYAMIWLAMIGTAYVFAKDEHLAFLLLRNKAKGTKKCLLLLVNHLLMFGFAAIVMVYGGLDLAQKTWHEITPALGLSMGMVYSVIPLSGLMIAAIKITHIKQLLATWREAGE